VTGLDGTPYAGLDGDVVTSGSRLFYRTISLAQPLLELDPATGSVRATYPLTGVPPGSAALSASVSDAAMDGGAYLAWQGVSSPHELTAYAS
jgi:hypothetical protein